MNHTEIPIPIPTKSSHHQTHQPSSHSLIIMAKEASLCLLFLSSLLISSSGALVVESGGTGTGTGTISLLQQQSKRVSKYLEGRRIHAELHTREDFAGKELKREEILHIRTRTRRRTLDNTNTVYQTPIITPPDTPTIITVPSSTNPVTISPNNPATAVVPVNVPSTTPVTLPPTNPANNSPATTTTPTTVPPPVTNPATSYPPPSVPVPVTNSQPPPSSTNTQGGSWCVAKSGAPQASLQSALDYACGIGGADCSQIQQGASCYSPVTLQNHASFAFNSYYQKHPAPTSCDFGGAATLVNTNPSSGSCIFPSSSSSSPSSSTSSSTPVISPPTQYSTPTTPPSSTTLSPPTPTTPPLSIPTAPPTTSSGSVGGGGTSGYGTPPSVLNSSNPTSGTMPTDFGSDSPPVVNTTSASHSLPPKPFTSSMVLMISFVTARLSMRS